MQAKCQDGKVRNFFFSGDGTPDTAFSIPAFVYVNHSRVYGYVTPDDVVSDGERAMKFVAYTYRKNHALVGG